MHQTADEYDTPWKEVLETYLRESLAFFLPEAYEDIDWAQGYTFLDKEMSRISRRARVGNVLLRIV